MRFAAKLFLVLTSTNINKLRRVMNAKKITLNMIAVLSAATLVSCQGARDHFGGKKVVQDCSAIFQTRYADNKSGASVKKSSGNSSATSKTGYGSKMKEDSQAKEQEQARTECKVLEVKLDNMKCEIVGSDRLEKLSDSLEKNRQDKTIFITSTEKLQDLTTLANRYLMLQGINVKKHFDSELFKNLNFPYRGMRCNVAGGPEFEVWSGEKRVVITVK